MDIGNRGNTSPNINQAYSKALGAASVPPQLQAQRSANPMPTAAEATASASRASEVGWDESDRQRTRRNDPQLGTVTVITCY